MKHLIYQVAVGEQQDLYEICIQSVVRYCERWDIAHVVQREPILRIRPRSNHRSEHSLRLGYLPIFEKENAFAYLDQYDSVLILDSDVYIRHDAPDIFAVQGSEPFAGVVERDMPLTSRHAAKIKKYSQAQYGPLVTEADFAWNDRGAAFFNMGVMLLRADLAAHLRGESAGEFIQRPEVQRFVDGQGSWRWSTDQTLLNYWLRRESIPTQCLDWRWNCLYGAVTSEAVRESYFLHFFLAQHHVADRDVRDIIQELHS
jgi:hypothetical protein